MVPRNGRMRGEGASGGETGALTRNVRRFLSVRYRTPRVGRSDVGLNARRIRRFLQRLKTAIARHEGPGAG